jgi:hypothetical protein
MTLSPARALDPDLKRALVSFMISRAKNPIDPRGAIAAALPEAERALDRMSVAQLASLETEMRMSDGYGSAGFTCEYDPFGR